MRAKLFSTGERLRRDDPTPAMGGDARPPTLRSIDRALREFEGRRLVSSTEVVDLLLDLRSAIVLGATLDELSDELQMQ